MDENLYQEAGHYLAQNCKYHIRKEVVEGKDKILEMYIDNYKAAVLQLDEILFSSEVVSLGDNKF